MKPAETAGDRPVRELLRRRAGALLMDNVFRGAAYLGRLHPHASPARHGVEVIRDRSYLPTGLGDHLLDVYRPTDWRERGPLPAVLYIHGGGFRILSKDTHWVMALAYARRGYVVFNINYRLAPRSPFPSGLMDCCAAYSWVVQHAAEYGGDVGRLVLAGESAGANLITALTVASCYQRQEPFARALYDTGVVPAATLPACGILQVTQPERFQNGRLSSFVADRLTEVSEHYLPGLFRGSARFGPGELDLADPLILLERGERPARPLPPFFAAVGTKDPLIGDTRRLKIALDRLGVECEAKYYPGEPHAFHALVWRQNARDCWRDKFTFLRRHVAPPSHR